jgi:hypothetical protein
MKCSFRIYNFDVVHVNIVLYKFSQFYVKLTNLDIIKRIYGPYHNRYWGSTIKY